MPPLISIGSAFEAEVDVVEELGADAYVYGRADVSGAGVDGQTIVARVDWRKPPSKGEHIFLAPADPTAIHLFATETGHRFSCS